MSQLPSNSPLNYATPERAASAKSSIRFRKGLFDWLVFIGLAVMLVLLVQASRRGLNELPLDQFYDHLNAGDVLSLKVEADAVVGIFFRSPITSAGVSVKYFRSPLPTGTTANWAFTQWLLENRHGAQVEVNDASPLIIILLPLVPWILIFGFIWFFVFRLRKVGKVTPALSTLPAGPIEVIIVNREPK